MTRWRPNCYVADEDFHVYLKKKKNIEIASYKNLQPATETELVQIEVAAQECLLENLFV